MKLHFKRSITLLTSLSMLTASMAQACMTIVNIPTESKVSSYDNIDEVFTKLPEINISIEGIATLNLPKLGAQDHWQIKNIVDIVGPFHVEMKEVLLESHPVTQIFFGYQQIVGERNRNNPMAWDSVKEVEMPIILSYEAKSQKPREVIGTLRVTSGKQIALIPEIRESVIQIVGETGEGSVNSSRPYRIEWADPEMGKHQWQIQEAEAEMGPKEHWWSRNSEPIKLKVETTENGQMIFRGNGHGTNMRILLKAIRQTDDKAPLPRPVSVHIQVQPTPLC